MNKIVCLQIFPVVYIVRVFSASLRATTSCGSSRLDLLCPGNLLKWQKFEEKRIIVNAQKRPCPPGRGSAAFQGTGRRKDIPAVSGADLTQHPSRENARGEKNINCRSPVWKQSNNIVKTCSFLKRKICPPSIWFYQWYSNVVRDRDDISAECLRSFPNRRLVLLPKTQTQALLFGLHPKQITEHPGERHLPGRAREGRCPCHTQALSSQGAPRRNNLNSNFSLCMFQNQCITYEKSGECLRNRQSGIQASVFIVMIV